LGERPRIEDGGVTWEGDARSMMRANLWLRTASRVLVRVARFKATAFFELEKRARKVPWNQFVAPGTTPVFRVTARKSKLYHSDAIAERLVNSVGPRATGTQDDGRRLTENADQLFVVRVLRDEFEISVDTSGELLHRRGYRQATAKAPLRETLGAALLIASGWKGDLPLLDPFCGSGTIPIEGALLARRIAPGLRRSFAFMNWPAFDAASWRAIVAEAEASALPHSPVPILGSDRDAGAIESAIANAERAGVAADVAFSTRAISAIEPPGNSGLIATNPPYGVRVSHRSPVRDLYAQIGHVLRERCHGWRIALYSPDPRLTREIGQSFEEVFRTTNGGIRVSGLLSGAHEAARSSARFLQ
jgi:putative N6-adenine-specific DNA methylase